MNPWLILAAALAIAGAYAGGRSDGRAIEVAAEARADRAAEKQRQQDQGKIDASATQAATVEVGRQADVRTITHDKETIIERRPEIYAAECVDADGVQLWRRAAAVANGKGLAEPVGGAAGAAAAAGGGERSDGGAAVPVVGP